VDKEVAPVFTGGDGAVLKNRIAGRPLKKCLSVRQDWFGFDINPGAF
jgi:hypothetical protein